jgi:hypothetical protein
LGDCDLIDAVSPSAGSGQRETGKVLHSPRRAVLQCCARGGVIGVNWFTDSRLAVALEICGWSPGPPPAIPGNHHDPAAPNPGGVASFESTLLNASASLCVLNQLDPLFCHLQPNLFVGLARRPLGFVKALCRPNACNIGFRHSSYMFRLLWKSFRDGA